MPERPPSFATRERSPQGATTFNHLHIRLDLLCNRSTGHAASRAKLVSSRLPHLRASRSWSHGTCRWHSGDDRMLNQEQELPRQIISAAALRRQWQEAYGTPPPPGLGRDLLARGISWKHQERTHGGFPPALAREL